MASSVSGQDESNPALWLATRVGKLELYCPLGTTRRVPQGKFPESHIINPLLTKLVRSRWLDIGLVLFFCDFMDLNSVSVHKHAKKELGQYLAILTSHLVNNPYLSTDATIKCFHMTSRQPYCICCSKTIKQRNLVPRVPSLPPSMRLVTCLRMPTKAAQRVGPQLKFC